MGAVRFVCTWKEKIENRFYYVSGKNVLAQFIKNEFCCCFFLALCVLTQNFSLQNGPHSIFIEPFSNKTTFIKYNFSSIPPAKNSPKLNSAFNALYAEIVLPHEVLASLWAQRTSNWEEIPVFWEDHLRNQGTIRQVSISHSIGWFEWLLLFFVPTLRQYRKKWNNASNEWVFRQHPNYH